jgi:hypothetical protein
MRWLVLSAFSVFLFLQNAVAQQETGSIEGHITNSATGFGISNVTLQIRSGNSGKSFESTTDEKGAFHITDVPYGSYGSTVRLDGYDRGTDSPNGSIQVTGKQPLRFEIQMIPWTTLRGRVLNQDGKPAQGIHMQLERFAQIGRGIEGDEVTDEQGRFVLDKTRPGSYLLWARVEAPMAQSPSSDPATVRIEPVNTYYPSGEDAVQAERISIRAGVDLPEFEIRLRTSPVYRVRGLVTDDNSTPAAHASLKLLSPRPNDTQVYGISGFKNTEIDITGRAVSHVELEVTANADGRFEFPSVHPGEWRVCASLDPTSDPVARDYAEPTGCLSVTVNSRDLSDLEIQLALPFDLPYSVDWGTAPLSDTAKQQMGPGVLLSSVNETGASFPQNGVFKEVLPGRYRVFPWPSPVPGSFVASARLAGREVLGEEVDLSSGASPLQIAYKPGGGTLRGTISKGELGTIVLLPRPAANSKSWTFIRSQTTGPDGMFQLENIEPGDYYVWAFDDVDSPAFISPAFVSTILSKGKSVQIQASTTETVELPLLRWPQ